MQRISKEMFVMHYHCQMKQYGIPQVAQERKKTILMCDNKVEHDKVKHYK